MRATVWIAAVLCWIGCSSKSPAPAADGAADHPTDLVAAAGHDGSGDSTAGSDVSNGADAPAPSDAAEERAPDAGGAADGAGDGADAPATSCPTDQPDFTTPCAAALTCHYGHASCCGIPSSAQTCLCQHGFFNCFQTVECNFTCPDGGFD
jgi:hypothetical protein